MLDPPPIRTSPVTLARTCVSPTETESSGPSYSNVSPPASPATNHARPTSCTAVESAGTRISSSCTLTQSPAATGAKTGTSGTSIRPA
ncbi:MAG: hypothetical protein M5U28_15790 [Sandaracinaceae bacterium]|nr:hypothetical protein [Sandaracinaceae bacterium]